MVAEIREFPGLVAVKEGIFPEPLDANPIAVFELVQVKDPPAGTFVKLVAATIALLQMVMSEGTETVGVGFTVIVNEEGVPRQPFTVGVTVIIPETEPVPGLVAVNEGIFPVPLEASPIDMFEFVQASVPPDGTVGQLVAGTTSVLQTAKLEGTVTVGVGLTVIVYVDGVPVQPLTVGVTDIVAVIGSVPVFVAVNDAMFPVPLEAKPIAVFEFDHVYDPPVGTLVKVVAGMEFPLQTVIFAGTETVGVGFTVIV